MAQINDKQIAKLRSLIVSLQDFADSIEADADKLTEDLSSRIEKFKRDERCLYCGLPLEKERPTRGCHPSCYNLLNQRIFRGKLTRAEAITNGWMNPVADKPGRKTGRPDPMRDLPPERQPSQDEANAIAEYQSELKGKRAVAKLKAKSATKP
jgi:hypothetical protein